MIESGVAQTRAALMSGDEVLRFAFGPARGDEALSCALQSGETVLGRVRQISSSLHAAFIDIGEAADGFLPLKKAQKPPPEGAAIALDVHRPAIGGKGAVLKISEAKIPPDKSPPARISHARSSISVLLANNLGGDVDSVVVGDAETLGEMRRHFQNTIVSENAFARLDLQQAIDEALQRTVAMPGGGRLIIDETEAMTVVDVDSGSLAEASTGRLNDKTNLAAAKLLAGELARRAIGGRLVVDFLPPSDAKRRSALLDVIRHEANGRVQMRAGKLSKDGVFDATLPRTTRSLLDLATEIAGVDWPRPGRRLSLDWTAKTAFHELERRMTAMKSARFGFSFSPALCAYLDTRPQWRDRLADRHGERCAFKKDDRLEDYRFVITEN